jgi:PAS domain-containing protein
MGKTTSDPPFFMRPGAEQSAGIGIWDTDLATDMVRATPTFFRLMGLPVSGEPIANDVVRAVRHPDDAARVRDGFRDALAHGIDSYEVNTASSGPRTASAAGRRRAQWCRRCDRPSGRRTRRARPCAGRPCRVRSWRRSGRPPAAGNRGMRTVCCTSALMAPTSSEPASRITSSFMIPP